MEELIKIDFDEFGVQTISARELFEKLEIKERFSKWFERMIGYGFEENVDFTPYQMVHPQNFQIYQDFKLSISMSKELCMLARNEAGQRYRKYFLNLEIAWNSPEQIMARALKMADKKITSLQTQIVLDQPYTNFGKAVSNSVGAIPIGEFCKILYQNDGIKIGRNKLFEWLRGKGYLIKDGREKNNPKQKYIESGLFIVVPNLIKTDKKDIQSATTLITGKGQVKIADELKLISA